VRKGEEEVAGKSETGLGFLAVPGGQAGQQGSCPCGGRWGGLAETRPDSDLTANSKLP
jgi:hypothetical protein